MAVMGYISNSHDAETEKYSFPVATQEDFIQYWIGAIESLKLQHWSKAQFDMEVTRDEMEEVLFELRKIDAYFQESPKISETTKSYLKERVDFIEEGIRGAFKLYSEAVLTIC